MRSSYQPFYGANTNGNLRATPTLVFEPTGELVFREKMGHLAGIQLLMKNKQARDIYFKIRSNKSHCYSVRPSMGKIRPHGQCKVLIQPVFELKLDDIEQQKHQFKILSAFALKPNITPGDFWTNIETQQNNVEIVTEKLKTSVFRPQSQPQMNVKMDDRIHVPASPKFSGKQPQETGGKLSKEEPKKNDLISQIFADTTAKVEQMMLAKKKKEKEKIVNTDEGEKEEMTDEKMKKQKAEKSKNAMAVPDDGSPNLPDEAKKVKEDAMLLVRSKREKADVGEEEEKISKEVKTDDNNNDDFTVALQYPIVTIPGQQMMAVEHAMMRDLEQQIITVEHEIMKSAAVGGSNRALLNNSFALYVYATMNSMLNKLTPSKAAQLRTEFDELIVKFEQMES